MTVDFETIWSSFSHVVEGVAASFGRTTHQYGADATDFQQEAVVYILDNIHKLAEKWEEMGDEDFTKYLARVIENEAKDYAVDVKAQALGYERHDLHYYSKGELSFLLDCVFDKQKWLEPPQSEGRSYKDPAHGGSWVATLADVSQGFDQLGKDDKRLLREFHQFGHMNKDLAMAYEVTEATMSARHTRALGRLLKKLGGSSPRPMRPGDTRDPWRGRKPISNATARAVQSSYYEES